MPKNTKKECKIGDNIESLTVNIQSLLKTSNDLSRIMTLFSELVDACQARLPKRIKKSVFKKIEHIFLTIECKLKWQKDPKKNQVKCNFYRKMAKLYYIMNNDKALRCYETLFTQFLKNFPKNFHAYEKMLELDFEEGRQMALHFRMVKDYYEMTDFIHDLLEKQNCHSKSGLYYAMYDPKITFYKLVNIGNYQKAKELSEKWLQIKKHDSWKQKVGTLLNILICNYNLGQFQECLKVCDNVLQLLDYNLDESFRDPNYSMYLRVTTLTHKALSLSELQHPEAKDFCKKILADYGAVLETIPITRQKQTTIKEFANGSYFEKIKEAKTRVEYIHNSNIPLGLSSSEEANERYDAYIYTLNYIRDLVEPLIGTQTGLQMCVTTELNLINSFCEVGLHQDTVRIFLANLFPKVRHVAQENTIITEEDVLSRAVQCQIYHCQYYDEALETLNQHIRQDFIIEAKPMRQERGQNIITFWIRLLIYKKEFKQAKEKMDIYKRCVNKEERKELKKIIRSLKKKEKLVYDFHEMKTAIIEGNKDLLQKLTSSLIQSHNPALLDNEPGTSNVQEVQIFKNSLCLALHVRRRLGFEVSIFGKCIDRYYNPSEWTLEVN